MKELRKANDGDGNDMVGSDRVYIKVTDLPGAKKENTSEEKQENCPVHRAKKYNEAEKSFLINTDFMDERKFSLSLELEPIIIQEIMEIRKAKQRKV
jgi:hypothetical protein